MPAGLRGTGRVRGARAGRGIGLRVGVGASVRYQMDCRTGAQMITIPDAKEALLRSGISVGYTYRALIVVYRFGVCERLPRAWDLFAKLRVRVQFVECPRTF